MNTNAFARPPDADAPAMPTRHVPANAPACDESLQRAAQHVSAPAPAEPERTVLRELHRMFALIAVR